MGTSLDIGVILKKEQIVRLAEAIDFNNNKALVSISGSSEMHEYKKIVRSVDIPSLTKSFEHIWEEHTIVEFDFKYSPDSETEKLRGLFSWNDIDGRWEIDFDESFSPYVCLYYNPETMSNFKILGQKANNKKLLKK